MGASRPGVSITVSIPQIPNGPAYSLGESTIADVSPSLQGSALGAHVPKNSSGIVGRGISRAAASWSDNTAINTRRDVLRMVFLLLIPPFSGGQAFKHLRLR